MRFKSVLGAFLFIGLAGFLALLVFIQTESFGRLTSKIITDLSKRKAQAEVSIRNISLSLFPPGLELHEVNVFKDFGEGKILKAQLGTLGFYLNLLEIEERNISFGEIRVSNSVLNYTFPEKKEEPLERIDQKMIDEIFDLSEKSPIRIDTLLVENIHLFINRDLMEAKRVKVFKKGESFMTRFHLSNFQPLPDDKYLIDEIWGDVEIGRKKLDIYRLRVQHDVQTLLIKGEITNYPALKNASLNLVGEVGLHLQNLENEVPLPETFDIDSGRASFHFTLNGQAGKYSGDIEGELANLRTNFLHADNITIKANLADQKLTLEALDMSFKTQGLTLIEPAVVVDFNSSTILSHPVHVDLNDFSLLNALRVLGPQFKIIQGRLTGKLSFTRKGENIYFKPHDGFILNGLGLVVGEEDPFTILRLKKAKLTKSEIAIENGEFKILSLFEMENSKLSIQGSVSKDGVNFRVPDATVDLEDFGNISNLDIKGRGVLDIFVTGPTDDTVINIKGRTKDFEILGYKLGETEKDLAISLKDKNVLINRMDSKYGTTSLTGSGAVNYGNRDIALGINTTQTNWQDLSQILHPVLSKVKFLPPDFDLTAKVDAQIYGKTRLPDLKVKSSVRFKDLTAYGETLSEGSFSVNLVNEVLSLADLTATKGTGHLGGDFSLNFPTEYIKINYQFDGISLSSFNNLKSTSLNFDGKLSGALKGEGPLKDYVLNLKTRLYDTSAPGYNFEDSKLDLKIMPTHVLGEMGLFGSTIKSDFDFALHEGRQTKVFLKVSIPQIKPVAVALLGQHLEPEDFSGRLNMEASCKFTGNFQDLDLKAHLKDLELNHSDFTVQHSSINPQMIIDNGTIKSWNLKIEQPDLVVRTKGEGTFGKKVSLDHDVQFNSKLLQLLLPPVLSSEGFIRNKIGITGRDNDYSFSATSVGEHINLTMNSVPFPINDLNYRLEYMGNRLHLEELTASPEKGEISLKGDVFFQGRNPDVNLKYTLDRAEFPLFGKSVINVSGEGSILGNDPPYSLSGEFLLNKVQIVNELTDFNQKSSGVANVRYLPKSQVSPVGKFLNLNVNIKAENPIRITNSLMDVALRGEVRLLGSPTRPRGEGRLYSPVNSSRIFFKNSEYAITSADLNFSPKKEITNPDFDIQATSTISAYRVNAKAYGDLERFSFDLTSDPPLSRNSILSLIAFGYTDEIQNSLAESEQQNLTQVGVGSFVFDRFRISDILKKQFGLQVNLGTVTEQSQTDSLLAGRSGDTQGGPYGRTRSATKIELKKKLDEALTLSVSSTMGGSIGQRQSMNLNYSVSKKVQLEGVYELRTNEEGEENIIDNSIGGDVKFRWTFK